MSKTYLQVKIISLADEQRTIRRKEIKFRERARKAALEHAKRLADGKLPNTVPPMAGLNETRVGLYEHRVKWVRPEARAALLAYGFLRGVPYQSIENKIDFARFRQCGTTHDKFWNRVISIAAKFGNLGDIDVKKAVEEWRGAHDQYLWKDGSWWVRWPPGASWTSWF